MVSSLLLYFSGFFSVFVLLGIYVFNCLQYLANKDEYNDKILLKSCKLEYISKNNMTSKKRYNGIISLCVIHYTPCVKK